jgi:hypothetical protein
MCDKRETKPNAKTEPNLQKRKVVKGQSRFPVRGGGGAVRSPSVPRTAPPPGRSALLHAGLTYESRHNFLTARAPCTSSISLNSSHI